MIKMACPIIGDEERLLINSVLDSRMLASGKYVLEFEKAFAKFSGTRFGIANTNGTTSLHIALLMAGVMPNDKVVTTPFSFIATVNSILFCQAKPVFVDIDPKTFNINPIELEKILEKEKNVKAVLIVHLYGLPCDMGAILELKKKYKFRLIEDACQAHGAEYKNKKVGSFGDVAAFSFYATKNMTTGEGGIVLTNSSKANKYGRQIINHGRNNCSIHTILGYNYRLTNFAAAIGIAQLRQLENWIIKRIKNAAIYNEAFCNLSFLQVPFIPNNCKHVFHQYTIKILAKNRKKFIMYLTKNGIETGIYYNSVVYKQQFYKKFGYKFNTCKVAENISKKVISIPVHPSLSMLDIEKIIDVIIKYNKK
ncbi:MAG: DegT/DnrJ/EryC1/StrS family aminotransferase [Endomicrobium sp.]|jgi:perosamine synthetase|nr:DegT/DnrJ/EryC1/StrS family aminotransferase [Endomicrobium sp.]